MPIYLAGTGETRDLETILISLAVILAVLAMISWGIPFFRDLIRRRREARELAELQALEEPHSEDDLHAPMQSMPSH